MAQVTVLLVHTWLTTQRSLVGSFWLSLAVAEHIATMKQLISLSLFDTLQRQSWAVQFVSDCHSANADFLKANHSLPLMISCSGSPPPRLISSALMSLHSLPTQLLSPCWTVQALMHGTHCVHAWDQCIIIVTCEATMIAFPKCYIQICIDTYTSPHSTSTLHD